MHSNIIITVIVSLFGLACHNEVGMPLTSENTLLVLEKETSPPSLGEWYISDVIFIDSLLTGEEKVWSKEEGSKWLGSPFFFGNDSLYTFFKKKVILNIDYERMGANDCLSNYKKIIDYNSGYTTSLDKSFLDIDSDSLSFFELEVDSLGYMSAIYTDEGKMFLYYSGLFFSLNRIMSIAENFILNEKGDYKSVIKLNSNETFIMTFEDYDIYDELIVKDIEGNVLFKSGRSEFPLEFLIQGINTKYLQINVVSSNDESKWQLKSGGNAPTGRSQN